MNLSTISSFGEKELSALNAKADVLAMRDANAWDEAVDWGVPDYNESFPAGVAAGDGAGIRLTRWRPPALRVEVVPATAHRICVGAGL